MHHRHALGWRHIGLGIALFVCGLVFLLSDIGRDLFERFVADLGRWIRTGAILGGPLLVIYGIRERWGARAAKVSLGILYALLIVGLGTLVITINLSYLGALTIGAVGTLGLIIAYFWWLRQGAPLPFQ